MKKLAVLASHNGSNLDAIYTAIQSKQLHADIALVISNNTDANVLQKAKNYNLAHFVVNQKNAQNPDQKIAELLQQHECELVVLAGYMKKLSSLVTANFDVINSHPSLLPNYGGVGMYGRFVHEAVIANKETKSGVSIHYVNEEYDEGKIILQKELPLAQDESVETLEAKVKRLEQQAVVEALELCLK
ncbi:MAG: phosphoribosylglycinamide formyltransferase [Sulfurimonas sp.]